MSRRLLLLLAILVATMLVAGLVLLAGADAQACMDWEGNLHVGHDDEARPFATTWDAFVRLLRDFGDTWTLAIYLAACAAPFLPSVVRIPRHTALPPRSRMRYTRARAHLWPKAPP